MTLTPRVVLDTNVVLSALLFAQGRLAPLREAWRNAKFQPLVSSATTVELVRVLAYPKFKLSPREQEELLSDYLPFCTAIRIPVTPPKTPVCRDPFDIPFLQLAITGKADYLITGDQDLLDVGSKFTYAISTPENFLSVLKGS